MDEATKNRIGLWLRGERAFGLTLVGPMPKSSAGGGAVSGQMPVVRAELSLGKDIVVSVPEPARVEAVSPETPLFGGAAPVPAPTSPEPLIVMDAPALSLEEKQQRLALMNQAEVSVCRKCRLCETRTHTVFGEGDPDARIFFIGEGPGETEDNTGRPFVGRAGELLNKQIAAMGLRREQVFIANIVKCRPPNNRVPAPDEVATCTPYLERQLAIVRPKVIVTLGLPAAKYMLKTTSSMGRLRGQWQDWRGIKLMPTYHPAFLLRSPTYENRSAVWSDLQKVMAEVGLPLKKPDGPAGS